MTPHTDLTCYAGDVPLAVMSTPADHEVLARHIADYLAGRIGELQLPGYQIHVHTDLGRFRTAAATFTELAVTTVQPVPGVTLSAGRIGAAGRCYTVAADVLEGRPGAWAVQVEGPVIDLYVAERATAPKYTLRMIREVMLRTYESAGGIIFHAAGLDIAGRTVMVCANRGEGKTTTLAALLHGLGCRGALLSNDRLIIHGQRQVVAVPLPVPIARGTLEAFPELWAAAPPGEAAALPRQFGTRDKTAFSARTFATAFGSRQKPGSALHTLVVPRFTDTTQPPQARRLTPAETLKVLTEACFTPVDEFWLPWLIHRTRGDAELAKAAMALCARLAVSVPCFQVEYGVRGPIDRLHRVLADLIGDLL